MAPASHCQCGRASTERQAQGRSGQRRRTHLARGRRTGRLAAVRCARVSLRSVPSFCDAVGGALPATRAQHASRHSTHRGRAIGWRQRSTVPGLLGCAAGGAAAAARCVIHRRESRETAIISDQRRASSIVVCEIASTAR
eukprot:4733985-Prymnesium_polylepis.1